eukprot:TRINITY_DN6187_c0_g3_i1.p1 TRINITY_DN6187_c0_g3~~TRINITY_DN6187_c0_g3_i1.p1  ORF type:complete len:134 (-),score=13.46 TRINITY_DN6187_c0_g3_i1:324-725(-)
MEVHNACQAPKVIATHYNIFRNCRQSSNNHENSIINYFNHVFAVRNRATVTEREIAFRIQTSFTKFWSSKLDRVVAQIVDRNKWITWTSQTEVAFDPLIKPKKDLTEFSITGEYTDIMNFIDRKNTKCYLWKY